MAENDKLLTGDAEDADKGERVELDTPQGEDQGEDVRVSTTAGEGDAPPQDKQTAQDKPQEGERRRETHAERRERWKKARERDQREMNFLRNEVARLGSKVETLQGVTVQSAAESVDARLADALNEVDTAERIIAAAISANNGADAVRAQQLRDTARQKAMTLAQQREALQRAPAQQQAAAPPPYAPLAAQFAADKPWFTWNPQDPDNRAVLELDNAVMRDGYNPMTPAYWQELERRTKEQLPHRFKAAQSDDEFFDDDPPPQAQQQQPAGRRGPPVASGREHAPTSTRNAAYISPERKQAMIEAGVWDDPVLRKKYAKAYSDWDRNNSASR